MSSTISAHYICRYDKSHPLAFYTELAERVQREVFPEFCINPSFLATRYHNLVAASSGNAFVTGTIDYDSTIGDQFGRNIVADKKSDIRRRDYKHMENLYHRDRERYDAAKAFAQKYISFGYVENNWHSDVFTKPHSDAVFLVAIDLAKKLRRHFQLPIHTIAFSDDGLEYSCYSILEAYYIISQGSDDVDFMDDSFDDSETKTDPSYIRRQQRVHVAYRSQEKVRSSLQHVISSFDLPSELEDCRLAFYQSYDRDGRKVEQLTKDVLQRRLLQGY